ELTELAENLPGVQNYRLTAAETKGDVVFLHKLEKGRASKSYGIAVAKLAGLPPQVIERAKDDLATLEKYELAVFANEKADGMEAAAGRAAAAQTSLFAMANESALEEIRTLDVEAISAEHSREVLKTLKERIV